MDWGFLSFLSEPWFVVPWYAIGILGAAWVVYDVSRVNTPLKTAMKWAWPIIVLFFSVLGLAFYFWTARAPQIGRKEGDEKTKAHEEYASSEFRKVTGSVIHCVAGDGLGIMSGMVFARIVGTTFWEEFWIEYLVGYLFGWFIFQFKAMYDMGNGVLMSIWMGGRAEFFSMLTVMAGMGIVMGFVTPQVVGEQPPPDTWAFWGFGMLGLLLGYLVTYPMNWVLVQIGWKHGMG